MPDFYPAFYEYDSQVLSWLRGVFDLPQFNKTIYSIVSATRTGTTGGGVDQNEIKVGTVDHRITPSSAVVITGTEKIDGYYMVLNVIGDVVILDPQYLKLPADQDLPGGMIKLCVNVIYGNMQRAVATIVNPLRQGVVKSPGVSFVQTDASLNMAFTRPKENAYTRRFYDVDGNKISTQKVPPMMEYKLSYSVNVWSMYRQFMTILDFQFLSEFRPEKFLWIPGLGPDDAGYGMDYEGCRMDRQFHGQWAHLTLESRADASEYEPGDAADRALRMEYTLTIDNAFLPMPFDDGAPIIGKVEVAEHIDTQLENLLFGK